MATGPWIALATYKAKTTTGTTTTAAHQDLAAEDTTITAVTAKTEATITITAITAETGTKTTITTTVTTAEAATTEATTLDHNPATDIQRTVTTLETVTAATPTDILRINKESHPATATAPIVEITAPTQEETATVDITTAHNLLIEDGMVHLTTDQLHPVSHFQY